MDAEYIVFQLSIHGSGNTLWIQHPLDSAAGKKLVGRADSEYTIAFDPGAPTVLLVNGKQFPVRVVPEKRAGNFGRPPLFKLGP